jgi:hypothetical protein
VYPPEPARPEKLTDAYVVELHAWANRVLGVATTDRLLWRGERKCIRRLQEAGQVR